MARGMTDPLGCISRPLVAAVVSASYTDSVAFGHDDVTVAVVVPVYVWARPGMNGLNFSSFTDSASVLGTIALTLLVTVVGRLIQNVTVLAASVLPPRSTARYSTE